MRKSKVFIGFSNTANLSASLAEALRLNGIDADYVSLKHQDKIFDYRQEKEIFQLKNDLLPVLFKKNITAVLNTWIKYIYFSYYIFLYNTFIFISPNSFLPQNNDLKILKALRRKIIFIFAGCPERDVNFMPGNPEYICNRCDDIEKKRSCLCYDFNKKAEKIQKLEFYSDYIVAQDDCASYLKYKKAIWLYVFNRQEVIIDISDKFKNNFIKIAHFPSNPKIKLSHLIIPVLERIRDEFDNIQLIIKSGISHEETIGHLSESHILVDALGLGYGVLATEAMSLGTVVITGKMDFIENHIGNNPIVKTSAETLYKDLLCLLRDKDEILRLAIESKRFYTKIHSLEAAGLFYKTKLKLQ